MTKKIVYVSVCLFLFIEPMQQTGSARKGTELCYGMAEVLNKSRDLLPEGKKTRGYHSEGFVGSDKLCCVPDPEPVLYADELLHMKDEQPLDQALADIVGQEQIELYSITEQRNHNRTLLEYYGDESTMLLLAKSIATKVGRPYAVIPASLLAPIDLMRLIDTINEKEQPYTVILQGLNNGMSALQIKHFIERTNPSFLHVGAALPKLLFIIISRYPLWQHYNNTLFEIIKPLNAQGRVRLLHYYLEKLPVQSDVASDQAYIATLAERTAGFSAPQLENFVSDVLLHALGAPSAGAEANAGRVILKQEHFESVLKDSYGVGFLQGFWSRLKSRYLEARH